MVKCCVPDCSSSSYNAKQRGVRFHEFPSNTEMREKWINSLMKFINKPQWSLKDRTRICNLHFKEDDYRPCQKKSVLLPHAYPTVFPNDQHWHSAAFSERNSSGVCSNVNLIDPIDTNCPIVEYVECTPEHDYRFRLACPSEKRIKLSDVVRFDNEHGEAEPGHDASISAEASQTSPSEILHKVVTIKSALKVKPPDKPNTIGRPPRSTQELRVLLKRKDKKICRLNKKICRLTNKVKALNNQIDKKNGKAKRRFFELVERIQQDASASNNVPAQFLLDQILAYGRKLPKYSAATLMSCTTWRSKFRKGYTYVQKLGLMRLPERTTLLKHNIPRKAKALGDSLLGLLYTPEAEICNDEEVPSFENAEDISDLSAKRAIISPALMAVSSHQDLHTGLLAYEIRYPSMGEVFTPEGI